MHRLLLIICIFLFSCSQVRMIETTLYFAQMRPDGSAISQQDWNNFKETHISRVFKEGSTTIAATGNWYDPDSHKLIREPSYVVTHIHKRSPYISRQIDSLTNLYKQLFQQQSILRVDKKVKAWF